MNGKRIVHFEDDAEWLEIVSEAVEESPHQLVAQADTLRGSLTVLDQIQAGLIEADVVILGGNLRDRRSFMESAAGDDPATIMEGIKERGLKVTTVGLAGLAMEEYGVEVDIDVTKKRAAGLLGETLDLLRIVSSDA